MMRTRENKIDEAVLCSADTGRQGTEPVRTVNRERGANGAQGASALAGLLLLACLFPLAIGCQPDTGVMPTNRSPVTYLSVRSSVPGTDLDTLGYSQILNWWGSDEDGRVVAYLVKWDGGWTPPANARHWDQDTTWIVTTATTDTFALATGGIADPSCSDPALPCPPHYGRHAFFVRAVDDEGAADPVGKTQEFQVENHPPVLEWSRTFLVPDSSLPAVAFAWHPIDRDGSRTVRSFLYWLTREGGGAALDTFRTADTLVALRPTAFGPPGDPQPGTWTLHAQAIDDSRSRSVPISHTWNVHRPVGDYLLIDNVGSKAPGGDTEDTFFRSMMDSLTAGNFEILDIEINDVGFRTDVEVGPYLSLFKGVVWYAGMENPRDDASVTRNLRVADRGNGLRDYLAGGGRLALFAQNAVGDTSGLSRTFQYEVLGITDWYRMRDETSLYPDYINGNIGLKQMSTIMAEFEGRPDSLRVTSPMNNADYLIVDQDITLMLTVAPGYLLRTYPAVDGYVFTPNDQTGASAVLGLLSRRSGRMLVTSVIPSRADGFGNRDRIVGNMLRQVLID